MDEEKPELSLKKKKIKRINLYVTIVLQVYKNGHIFMDY